METLDERVNRASFIDEYHHQLDTLIYFDLVDVRRSEPTRGIRLLEKAIWRLTQIKKIAEELQNIDNNE